MDMTVNGQTETVKDGLTLAGYLTERNLDPESLVVELNLAVVPRDQFTACVLKDGDSLEIVRFVGGG